MFKALLSKNRQKRPAQALVEFTLVALVFLLLIVMIIEVARILQAYVTIQHAAREAARYAVTGQFDPKYGADPTAGWQDDRLTAEPLRSIRPCWPIFSVENYDPAFPNAVPRLLNGSVSPILHQPYRSPRTCSVEEAAVRNMAGLIMNPNARVNEPDYYEIVIGGTAWDIDPTTGTFERHDPPETKEYDDYYDPAGTVLEQNELGVWVSRPLSEVQQGTSRGYAGDPGTKVIVQIDYRIRMITPLLSNIVRSVKLSAYATMTVETFGGMGLQREAVPPPPDPKPLPMTDDIVPPDLHVVSLTCPVSGALTPTSTVLCTVDIRNRGNSPSSASKVRIYRRLEASAPSSSPDFGVFDNLFSDPTTPPIKVADIDIGPLDPHDVAPATTPTFFIDFPYGGGDYYVYAWADPSATTLPSDDKDGDSVVEENPITNDPELLTNNLAVLPLPLVVTDSADVLIKEYLTPDVIPSKLAPDPGETITFTVTVRNDSPTSSAQGVTLSIPILDPELTCAAPCGIDVPFTMTPGQEISHIFTITPSSNIGIRKATIRVSSTSPNDLVQVNNSVEVEIRVGGVVLDVAKSVAPLTVDYNASAPSAVTYTVRVQNMSAAGASNITVSDPLDVNLQHVLSTVTPSGTCDSAGCTGITLSANGTAGDTATITIQAQVKAATPAGTIPNTATVSSPQSVTKTASAGLVVRGVDIVVTKKTEGDVTSVLQGAQYIYIVQAKNSGTIDAQNVNITDVLDTTYLEPPISATADVGSYTSGVWAIGTLNADSTATLRITVKVKAAATVGASIPNTAALQAGVTPPETNTGNNSASYPVTVSSISADLALTKIVAPTGTVVSGTPLTYTLTLTNNSPSVSVTGRTVSDTILRDAFSSGRLRFVSATVSPTGQGSFSSSTGLWTGISLAPGQTATATINVVAVGRRGTTDVFSNTANTVADAIPDPASPGPNSATATIQINWPDPIFINAGDPTGGGDAARRCNQVTWGSEDAIFTDSVLGARSFTWTVEPNANWTRTDGVLSTFLETYDLAANTRFFILSNQNHVQAPAGQNLFGCRTMSGGAGNIFSYRFNNLVPGTWRLYLAFAEFDTFLPGRRLLDVSTDGAGSFQTLPGMDDFDIVRAIWADGNNPNWDLHGAHWDVHYIIKRFDVTVNTQGYLDVKFEDVASNRRQAQVNGLGIEYIQP